MKENKSHSSQSSYSPIRVYRKKGPAPAKIIAFLTIILLSALLVSLVAMLVSGLLGKKGPSVPGETTASTNGAPDGTTDGSGTTVPETTDPAETTGPSEDKITYQYVNKSHTEIAYGDLVLIDADHVFIGFSRVNLISLYDNQSTSSYKLSGSGHKLTEAAFRAFEKMMDDFVEATKKEVVSTEESTAETTTGGSSEVVYTYFNDVQVTGAYRSFDYQNSLYKGGKNPDAAKPGSSDYHCGNTLSLNVLTDDGKTVELSSYAEESAWFKENAHKYGFIFRYPSNKKGITGYSIPWQIRYVGVAHATYMKENNLCLEEYLDELAESHRYGESHIKMVAPDGKRYEIFYVPTPEAGELRLPIPDNRPFTVSGDNKGGFIVTITAGDAPVTVG